MKERNQPVGKCPCPVRTCKVTDAPVFKFRGRENKLQQRLAGKFYLQCPEHGRFGADGKQSAIDYIAENMTWLEKQSAGERPEKPVETQQPKPAQPTTPAPSKRSDLWDL